MNIVWYDWHWHLYCFPFTAEALWYAVFVLCLVTFRVWFFPSWAFQATNRANAFLLWLLDGCHCCSCYFLLSIKIIAIVEVSVVSDTSTVNVFFSRIQVFVVLTNIYNKFQCQSFSSIFFLQMACQFPEHILHEDYIHQSWYVFLVWHQSGVVIDAYFVKRVLTTNSGLRERCNYDP